MGVVPLVGVPSDGPLREELARRGIATLWIPDCRWSGTGLRFARRYVLSRLMAAEFAPFLRRLGVDLVHSNTTESVFGALAARRVGLPHVWHLHGLKHDWLTPRAVLARGLARRTLAATADGIVVPSLEFGHRIAPYAPDVPIRVVPNGLLCPEHRRHLEPLRPTGELRILTVGREKGWTRAVDCLAELTRRGRAAYWTFVGIDDPKRTRAHALALGLADRIRFVGHVEDPSPFYLRADVHVLPSSYETFGRVLVEAMAVGCPVVAHRVGGIPEVVSDGETGRLVEVGDVVGMADAILEIADDPERTERLRHAAWSDVWERFTVERFAGAFQEIYRDCVERSSGSRF